MERTSMPGFAIEALNSVRQVNLETSARVAADMVSKPGEEWLCLEVLEIVLSDQL